MNTINTGYKYLSKPFYVVNACRQLAIIIFLLIAGIRAGAQTAPQKHMQGETRSVYSLLLKEDRTLYIHVPALDTADPNKRYPVLYLLDGESHFDMLSQYADYLSRRDVNVIPEMVVVAIINTKRTRDLTPTKSIVNYFGKPDTSTVSWMKPSGGNETFLRFIKEELIPFVEQNYKTSPYRIFAGHSFGGIATIHCLLTQPDLFNAYIAISPSLWWDGGYIIQLAADKLQSTTVLDKILFYSDASEGVKDSSTFHSDLLKFDALLTSKKIKRLDFAYKYYPAETHMTEPLPAYYDALRYIFRNWTPSKK